MVWFSNHESFESFNYDNKIIKKCNLNCCFSFLFQMIRTIFDVTYFSFFCSDLDLKLIFSQLSWFVRADDDSFFLLEIARCCLLLSLFISTIKQKLNVLQQSSCFELYLNEWSMGLTFFILISKNNLNLITLKLKTDFICSVQIQT